MLSSVLVANRGEIARRVFRTCRDLGLATVAVYSDADAGAPHVAEADAAVRLPGEARGRHLPARRPADRGGAAGRRGRGPSRLRLPVRERRLRSRRAGRRPDLDRPAAGRDRGDGQQDRVQAADGRGRRAGAARAATRPTLTEADLPVLIKASAGGGGRGMRIVRALAELPAELDGGPVRGRVGVRRSDRVLRALRASRAGTSRCRSWPTTTARSGRSASASARSSAGIRRSSRKRRRRWSQRLPGMRERLFDGGPGWRRPAIGYRNAGTVEFLADEDGRFYFLEMNTRLQVEHPVTECTTGPGPGRAAAADRGGPPAAAASPPPVTGHAIEARLYAEDPAAGWQPQSGTLHQLRAARPPGRVPSAVGRRRSGTAAAAGLRRRRRQRGRHLLRPDAGQGDRLGAGPGAGGRGAGARRSPRRGSTA